jgi:hypothetical protein
MIVPVDLDQPELVAEEIERLLEIAHSQHRVQVLHRRVLGP